MVSFACSQLIYAAAFENNAANFWRIFLCLMLIELFILPSYFIMLNTSTVVVFEVNF